MADTSPNGLNSKDKQQMKIPAQQPVLAQRRAWAKSSDPSARPNWWSKITHLRRRHVPQILQMTAVECGAACLAMILSYYGRKTGIAEIRDRYGVGRDGLSARSIVKAARAYGLRVRGVSVQENAFQFVSLPAIIHWEFNHFVVVERWTPQYVDIVDPGAGRRRLTVKEFEAGFTGIAIMLEPGTQFDRRSTPPLLTLRAYARQYIKRAPAILVQILVASLILQLFGLSMPLLTKVLIDNVIPNKLSSVMNILGVGIIVVVIAQGLIGLLRSLLLIYLQNRIDTYFMPSFIEHMLQLPLNFFQQRSSGDILARVSSNTVIRDLVSSQFISAILDGSLVIVYLFILLWQSWTYTIVVLLIGVAQIIILLCSNRYIRRLYNRELESLGKAQGYVTEMLTGIETLKAAGAEQQAFQRWINLFCEQLNVTSHRSSFTSIYSTFLGTLRTLAPLLLLWIGTLQVINGTMQVGTMLALNALAATFLMPLASLVSSGNQLQLLRSHLGRIADVLEANPEQNMHEVKAPPILSGRIRLEHVSFQYDPNASRVLNDISVTVEAGQKIALVGRTGSGKSTLGKLLLGLYLPTEGEIYFDDIPLRQLDFLAVRSQFGVVMQESMIFSGTIRQNISLSNPDISLDHIIKAAQIAALDEDVDLMPMGYETFVAESGKALSGGQRQRLALARALINSPSILLLDEATSSLDVVTERKVESNLKALACTQIIIAHRLSTVQNADWILVLGEGGIIEQGTHDSLLAQGGYYARLIQSQLVQDHKAEVRQ